MGIEAIRSSEAVTVPVIENKREHQSYIYLLQNLLAQISEMSIRLNESKHASTNLLRLEIRKNSEKSSELQSKIGSAAMWSGLMGLGFTLLLLSPEREPIRNFCRWSGEQGSRFINDMRANTLQARKGPLDALIGMEQTEYQAKASSQADSNTSQLVDRFNEQIARMNADAARGG